MIRKTLVGLLVISVALAFGTVSFAKKGDYEEGAVSGGGSISGSVSPEREILLLPSWEDLNKGKNVEFCVTHPDTKDGGMRLGPKLLQRAAS